MTENIATTAGGAPAPSQTGQPSQLYILFFAEMWERFSYYGMRALLVLYMTQEFVFSDDRAYVVYGAYTSLVYATPFIGGMIADRILGRKKAVTLGGILMAAGHFLMAFPPMWAFYGALGLLIAGNGLFKPNISTMVGELYKKDDPRRDGGFTIFYMGINLGAFLAPLVCGWIGENVGWHYGFGLAGVGMVLGQIVFSAGGKKMAAYGNPPDPEDLKRPKFAGLSKEVITYIAVIASVAVFSLLVRNEPVNPIIKFLMIATGVVVLAYLFYSSTRFEEAERHRMWVVLVLIFFSTLFWSFFEQAGSSINLFTERNVDRGIFGWEMPTSWGQSFNPAFILLLGVPFAALWTKLGTMHREPPTPLKFTLGIFQLGLGFLVLAFGARLSSDTGQVAIIWLILGYLLHTTGELCLSPVGLSMVTKLAPMKIVSMVMGAWFLSNAFANYLASVIARFTSVSGAEGGSAEALDPIQTVAIYGDVFQNIGLAAMAATVLSLALVPLLRKWMHGIH